MPPTAQTSSQHRDPLVPSERYLRPAGPDVRGDSPERSALTTYDALEGKARQMCGGGAPVIFSAVDWGLPRLVGEDAELVFTVHTGHRVAIRLPREKAARLQEALGLTLADAGVAIDPAPIAAGPARMQRRDALSLEAIASAWQRFRSGTGSVHELAKKIGCDDVTLRSAFERTHGVEFELLRNAYMGGRRGPMLKTWMDRRLEGVRLPIGKPNGSIL